MNQKCPICFGIGWVCENHPDKPRDKELGCECVAGMTCECNSAGEPSVDEPDTSQVIVEEDKISRHWTVALVH
jgi:hypothetical protein